MSKYVNAKHGVVCAVEQGPENFFGWPSVAKLENANENLIRISDAVRIARDALQDMQYGYSYDDLTVEVERKMYDNVLSAADIIYGDEESVDV